MNAEVLSVTYFEDGHKTVSFACPKCAVLHEHYVWPDGGLRGGNIIGHFHCNRCSVGGEVVLSPWAFDPRHRTGYRRYLQPTDVLAGGDFGRDDNAMDDPANNWEEEGAVVLAGKGRLAWAFLRIQTTGSTRLWRLAVGG